MREATNDDEPADSQLSRENAQLSRDDVEALLATRRELGPDYEAALVDSFAERVERAVAARTTSLAEDRRTQGQETALGRTRQFVLGVVSLGVGVPITIVPTVAAEGALAPVVVAWLGIAAVNTAHALSLRSTALRRRG